MTQPSRPGRVLFIDLNCSERMQRVLRAFARFNVRLHAIFRSSTARPDSVIVSTQPGTAPVLGLPAYVQVRLRSEFESPDSIVEVMRWTMEATNHIASDERTAVRDVHGLSLWELAKMPLQALLLDHAHCVAALRVAGRSGSFDVCDILTPYPASADALLAEASRVFPRARCATRAGLSLLESARAAAERVRQFRSPGKPAAPSVAPQSLRRQRPVLVVSESRPMSEMFSAIAASMQRLTGEAPIQLLVGRPDTRAALDQSSSAWQLPFDETAADRSFANAFPAERLQAIAPIRPAASIADRDCEIPLAHLPGFVRQWFPPIAAHVARAKAVLDQFSPSLVVVGNDRWYVGQAFVHLARQRGIPTLGVQDGISADVPAWSWITADHFATSGPALRDHLVAQGVDASRLTVTGQPRYDRLTTVATPAARAAARAAVGRKNRVVVTFATQPLQDAAFVQSVIRGILMVPEIHLIVRPHPSGDSVDIPAIVSAFPSERLEIRTGDTVHDLLLGSDVLVTQHSTVAVEAAILGVPVVTVDFIGSSVNVPYARLGISVEATSVESIAQNVGQLAADSARGERTARARAALEYLMGPLDGKAAERVAALIERLRRSEDRGARSEA